MNVQADVEEIVEDGDMNFSEMLADFDGFKQGF